MLLGRALNYLKSKGDFPSHFVNTRKEVSAKSLVPIYHSILPQRTQSISKVVHKDQLLTNEIYSHIANVDNAIIISSSSSNRGIVAC